VRGEGEAITPSVLEAADDPDKLRTLPGLTSIYGDGPAPRLQDFRATFGAMGEAGTLRQAALCAPDAIRHGRIDLILYGAVACPTRCHE